MKKQEFKDILKKDISASDILENLVQSCLSKMEACLDIYYNNLFSDRIKDYQDNLKRTFNSTSIDIRTIFFEIYEIVDEKYNNPEEILSDMYGSTSDELYIYKMFEKVFSIINNKDKNFDTNNEKLKDERLERIFKEYC